MSGAIGPGDWVECVDASPHRNPEIGERLSLGVLYQLRDVYTSPNAAYLIGVRVNGLRLPMHPNGLEHGWLAHRFRLSYRPKQSIIDALKAPPKRAPREREDA